MTDTRYLVKTPITFRDIRQGDILEGYPVRSIARVKIDDMPHVSVGFPDGVFGELTPADQPVSVYR